jgi:tetratricopeptide (TPR) repeat protein
VSLSNGATLGHYRILAHLGAGGMGEVYRALDTKLGRDVALKVLPPIFAGDPERIDRFAREARVVASLNHPYIVTIFSVEETDGVHFLTMELVNGDTLEKALPSNGLPVAQVLEVACALADALPAAHSRGIVHRDLKPANVMITREQRVKVLDFGLAKMQNDPAAGSPYAMTMAETGAGLVLGTVPYMSPEQVEGKALDQRSDIFSLGVLLYEISTGRRPFQGASAAAVLSAILRDAPADVCTSRPEVPSAFGALVARCLEKDRDRRTLSAAEIRDSLAAIRRSPEPSGAAGSEGSRSPKVTTEADRLVEEGARAFRFALTGGSGARTSLDQAEIYLKRALAIAPAHAKGLCEYATWHYMMANQGFLPTEEATAKGRQLAMAALAADDQSADTHAVLGKLFLYADDDFHAGSRHADRAVTLAPSDPEALRFQSVVRKLEGRFDEGIAAAQAAAAIAPEIPAYWNSLGDVLLAAGRHEEAVAALRTALSRQAEFGAALERMEQALIRLGRADEAIDFRIARLRAAGQADRADRLLEDSNRLGAVEARRQDLLRDVERLLADAAASDPFARSWLRTTSDRLIIAYAELGDWANVMTWIERSYAKRPGRLRRVLMDLPIDRRGLATNPRYARLLRVAGLEGLERPPA